MSRRLITAVAMALLVSGCASTKTAEDERNPQDPIERINRGTYAFNSFFDRILFKPVAKGYSFLPRPIKLGVTNFFNNLGTPINIVNNLLQGKPRAAGTETGRLLVNSTLGLAGLFDPATRAGIQPREEDFGQTLGAWGVPSGPFFVIPFLGPSSFRDGPGLFVDVYTHPLTYYDNSSARTKLYVLLAIERRASVLGAEKALEDAYDEYAFVRDAFLQRRQFLVYDGNPPEEDFEEFEDDFDDEDLSEFE